MKILNITPCQTDGIVATADRTLGILLLFESRSGAARREPMLQPRYGAEIRFYTAVLQDFETAIYNEIHEFNCKHYPSLLPSP
jgi:hypothetical protein